MPVFRNGHPYPRYARLLWQAGYRQPVVKVNMRYAGFAFMPILGLMDTGAVRTLLSDDSAARLGIPRPFRSDVTDTSYTVLGDPFTYPVYRLTVRIPQVRSRLDDFQLDVGVVHDLAADCFGADWLRHLCLAFDRQAVHFLGD